MKSLTQAPFLKYKKIVALRGRQKKMGRDSYGNSSHLANTSSAAPTDHVKLELWFWCLLGILSHSQSSFLRETLIPRSNSSVMATAEPSSFFFSFSFFFLNATHESILFS